MPHGHLKLLHQKHQRNENDERPLVPGEVNPHSDPPAPVGKPTVRYHDPKPAYPGGDPLRREIRPIEERYNPVDDGIEPIKP